MDLGSFLSIGIGASVTWLVTWLYYKRAAAELRTEAAELRRQTTLILLALEKAEFVELSRDSTGRITGFTIRGQGSVSLGPITISGTGRMIPPPEGGPEPDSE